MAKHTPAWHALLPGGKSPATYSLDELRAAKQAHAFLTEAVDGPEGIAYYIRGFRFLLFFGLACVAEDKYPPLTRCWKDLETRFGADPAFDDGVFVPSWILMDFPFGPAGETAVDYFEQLLKGTDAALHWRPFIEGARRSRLGLHQDVMHSRKYARFRELFTDRVVTTLPSIEPYGKGEILLTRTVVFGEDVFLFGNAKGFPKETKGRIEEMILDKLCYLDEELEEAGTPSAQYERFMKLAGPYWMSCVTKNENAPFLDPDHYRSYLERPAR